MCSDRRGLIAIIIQTLYHVVGWHSNLNTTYMYMKINSILFLQLYNSLQMLKVDSEQELMGTYIHIGM